MSSKGVYAGRGKRAVDVAVATAGLIVLSPIFAGIALVIRFFDPGPVIFCQTRIGRDGISFAFYKFRSMPVGTVNVASEGLGAVQIGPVGRFIRRTNLDELPQLVNVLRGDMSLVGPRPPIPEQTELIKLRRANGALACRPGLTGRAQINSYDGMTAVAKAALDGEYAQRLTLVGDARILARTFAYLLKPPPVY